MNDEDSGRVSIRVSHRETLAAAHAESGNFTAAVQTIDSALALSVKEDWPRLCYRRNLFKVRNPTATSPAPTIADFSSRPKRMRTRMNWIF